MDTFFSSGGALLAIGAGSALLFTWFYLGYLKRRVKGLIGQGSEKEETLEWQAHALREAMGVVAEDRDRLNAILSSIGEGIIVLDLKRKVVLMNQVAGIMLRSAPAEAVGRQLEHVCDLAQQAKPAGVLEPRRELLGEMFRRVTKEVAIEATRLGDGLYCRKLDGTTFPVSFVMAPLLQMSERAVGGAVFVFRDVTEERRVDEAKSEFVSLASHQLRTPLSTIGVYAELLRSGEGGTLTTAQTSYVGEIQTAVEAMTGLISDLLEISRIDLGLVEATDDRVDLCALVDEELALIEGLVRTKELHVERQYPPSSVEVVTNKRWLQIIVQNILSNAVKYISPRGEIALTIEDKKTDFLFSVRDSGWGIPQHEQGRIFERFFRASNAKKQDSSGTGLGLYVTKRLVEKLGGKIWFESEKDRGAVFYVRFPKKVAAQPEEERHPLAISAVAE